MSKSILLIGYASVVIIVAIYTGILALKLHKRKKTPYSPYTNQLSELLSKSGQLIIPKSKWEESNRSLIKNATDYIKILSITGITWMPPILEELRIKAKKGLEIVLLIMDIKSNIRKEWKDLELKLITNGSEKEDLYKLYNHEEEFVKYLHTILGKFDNVRIVEYDKYPVGLLPFWRGTIADGKIALSVIPDNPRPSKECRLKKTNKKEQIKFLEEYYFRTILNNNKPKL